MGQVSNGSKSNNPNLRNISGGLRVGSDMGLGSSLVEDPIRKRKKEKEKERRREQGQRGEDSGLVGWLRWL